MIVIRVGGLAVQCCVMLAGCERGTDTPNQETANAGATIPAAVFVEASPGDAIGVKALKDSGRREGDVIVRGRIGGRARPFVEGAAVFVLVDSALKPCNELHGDKCATPWDYCCETPEAMAANTLTVQIVDADGRPIRRSAENAHGLASLSTLVVAGEIAGSSSEGALIVNARRIWCQAD